MITHKLKQRWSDICGAGHSVGAQRSRVCMCVLQLQRQCVHLCVCLTKGEHCCGLHTHQALQEKPDKGGLFTIIMHLIFGHQTLLPGLITRSLI